MSDNNDSIISPASYNPQPESAKEQSAPISINQRAAPLSHLQNSNANFSLSQHLDWRVLGVIAAVGLLLTIAWNVEPARITQKNTTQDGSTNSVASTPASSNSDEALAPYAATQRERARKQAQDALSLFVERQIQLEENMQVDAWGAEQMRAAMSSAQDGDEHFLAERFAQSITAYESAAEELSSVIALGGELFETRLSLAEDLLNKRDHAKALTQTKLALQIKPGDSQALAIQARVAMLPDVVRLLRDAKNHELGARYDEALAAYNDVQDLDPQTQGLDSLRAKVRSAIAGQDLNGFLTTGFAALESNNFEASRKAFRSALKLEPGNAIAKGGLQQVDKRNDLALIARLRKRAEAAVAREDWVDALAAYQQVIDLDGAIRFAQSGKGSVLAYQKSQNLLEKIAADPQKLASEKLYLEAKDIVAQANRLPDKGPNLSSIISDVESVLVQYRDPVNVVLLSDEATDVILSNVGPLGTFDRKELSLRPGQYTIRGSQKGCKDIYLTVSVLPGLAPISVRCEDRI